MVAHPVRDEYNRLASGYDRRWRRYVDVTLNAAVDAIEFQGRESVLDVACGTGELEMRLHTQWPDLRLTGVDLSSEMLAQAKLKDKTNRVKWVEGDVARLPLPDQSFDCVFCVNSFHYFPSARNALAEMRRVLRHDGSLVLVDWCDDYLACKVCSWWLRRTDRVLHHTYTLSDCASLFERANFTIDAKHRFRATWLWGLMSVVGHRFE